MGLLLIGLAAWCVANVAAWVIAPRRSLVVLEAGIFAPRLRYRIAWLFFFPSAVFVNGSSLL